MHIHSALKQPERRIYKFLVFEKPIIMMLMLLLAPTPPPPSWWETLLATSWGCILYIPYLLGSRSSFSFFFPPWFQFRFYMRWNFWKKHNLLLCKTCSFCYTRVLYSRSVERWTIFLWRLCCVSTCVRLCWWIFPKDDTLLWPITTMGYSCLFPPENSMI